jgi:hypothetical protein
VVEHDCSPSLVDIEELNGPAANNDTRDPCAGSPKAQQDSYAGAHRSPFVHTQKEMNMKAILIAVAAATLAVSPAFAKSAHKHRQAQSTRGLYMQSVPVEDPPALTIRGNSVTDPDPSIRSQLMRGYQAGSTD